MKEEKEVHLAALARAKGVSRKAVYVAVQTGRITRNPNGKFFLEQTLDAWERNTHPLCGGRHDKPPQEHIRQVDLKEPPFSHPLADLHIGVFETSAPLIARKLQALGLAVEQIHQTLLWVSWIQMEVLAFYVPELEGKNWIPITGVLAVLGDETQFAQWLADCNERFERAPLDEEQVGAP